MNNKIKIVAVLILVAAFVYKSCTKDNGINAYRKTAPVADVLHIGIWKISLLQLNDRDQTAVFDRTQFEFDANGSVIASSNNTSIKGNWSLGMNDNPNYLNLNFAAGTTLSELNGGWNITKADNFIVQTERLTGSTRDILNFEKVEKQVPVPDK